MHIDTGISRGRGKASMTPSLESRDSYCEVGGPQELAF